MLDRERVWEFVERGFLVVPQVASPELVDAATRTVDGLLERDPPPEETRGPHFYFPDSAQVPALAALLGDSPAFELAESLTGPSTVEMPGQAQVALNIPPFAHRPGMHHIDGYPPESDGRPGTFTILAGVFLSDQLDDDAGNLWVWPGTHLIHGRYFREHGPDALVETRGYPPIPLPEPEQIHARAGDLLLAHYLLGHNIGGNTSSAIRRTVYFRVKRSGHDERWRGCLQDPWLEYDTVRDVMRDNNGD